MEILWNGWLNVPQGENLHKAQTRVETLKDCDVGGLQPTPPGNSKGLLNP